MPVRWKRRIVISSSHKCASESFEPGCIERERLLLSVSKKAKLGENAHVTSQARLEETNTRPVHHDAPMCKRLVTV